MEDICTISHLNHEGDTKYTWNSKNEAECEAAKEHFESLRKKGFLAFKINMIGFKGKKTEEFSNKDGGYIFKAPDETPELAREFDPNASYVVVPQMVGG